MKYTPDALSAIIDRLFDVASAWNVNELRGLFLKREWITWFILKRERIM